MEDVDLFQFIGLYAEFKWPLPLACPITIAGVAVLFVLVHALIILGAAPNQSAAGYRGGLPLFLQSFAIALFYSLRPFAPETSLGQLLPMSSLNR